MRYLIVFILLLNAFNGHAQSYQKDFTQDKATINYPDHVLKVNFQTSKSDKIAKPDRRYFWYSANQIHTTQGGYSGKLLDGLYEDFYLNKNLKERGQFSKGIKTGEWTSWSESGSLNGTYHWRNGEKAGSYLKYDIDGRLIEKGRYRNDLLSGKQVIYSAADSVVTTRYKNGHPYINDTKVSRLFKKVKTRIGGIKIRHKKPAVK